MPQPFSVRDQDRPGVDLGMWDKNGNIVIPGTVTANGVVLGGGGGGGGSVASVTATNATVTVDNTDPANPKVAVTQSVLDAKVDESVLTTKGDLYAASGSATPVRVAVGSNGQVLTADTAQTAGVKWAPAGGTLVPFTLTDQATITTDASLGSLARVTITASRIMAAPTNPADGAKLIYQITQGGVGSFLLTWNAVFNWGDWAGQTLSTAAGKRDYIAWVYNSAATKWDFAGATTGF